MADRAPAGDHKGFLPLSVACARAYLALTGRRANLTESAEWGAQLDSVALALSVVARIYATEPLTNLLFLVSEAELKRGNFQGGAKLFVHDGKEPHGGLHIAVADFEDAIRILAAAGMPR